MSGAQVYVQVGSNPTALGVYHFTTLPRVGDEISLVYAGAPMQIRVLRIVHIALGPQDILDDENQPYAKVYGENIEAFD